MQRVEKEVCGRTLSFEHGQVARQADGGLLARYGDTVILASAVYAKEPPKDYLDYFPLIVDYRVLAYAAGKIGPSGRSSRQISAPTRRLSSTCFRPTWRTKVSSSA
jgi:polyribonucleotide nucleotidyltransferase